MLKTLRLLPYACAVLALSAGTAAHGQEGAARVFPLVDGIEGANQGCGLLFSDQDGRVALVAAGWTSVTPEPNTWLAQQLENPLDLDVSSEVFAKLIGGFVFFLIDSVVTTDDVVIETCHVRQPQANLRPASAAYETILNFAGRPPVTPTLMADDLAADFREVAGWRLAWRPGLHEGAETTLVGYLPLENSGPNRGLTFSSTRILSDFRTGNETQ